MVDKKDLKCNYDIINEKNKLPVLGIRHLQIGMMCLVVTVLLIIRSSMGVAVLAMTSHKNNSTLNITDDGDNQTYSTDGNTTETENNSEIDLFDWDEKIQGGILSAFFWGYMLNQIPGSIVAKRFGGKPVLLASLIINGVLCLTMPILAKIGGWKTVCAVRWMMGLTQCVFPSCHTLLGKWVPPHERTRLSNVAYAGVQIGTIISLPLGGLLARTTLGWKLIFYSTGGLAFVTAALWAALAASSPAEHRLMRDSERKFIEDSLCSHGNSDSMSIPWRRLATSVPLLALLASHIGTNWTFTIFFVEIPTYMNNVLGINLKDSGILSALPFAAMWFLSIVFGVLCEHLYNNNILSLTTSRKVFNSIGLFGPAIGLVILSFVNSTHPYVAIGVLTLTVGVLSAIGSGFMMNHLDLSPTYAGVMLGITNAISTLVAALAPIVTGYILGDNAMELSRWRLVFFLTALILIVSDVVFVVWGTSERQPWDDPAYNKNQHELEVLKSASDKLTTEKVYKFEEKKT